MNQPKRALALIAFASCFLAGFSLMAQQETKVDTVTRVDAKYVCFITKHKFDKEQLPVPVDGKTYYGCCDMCKAKLKNDVAARYDIDPVSGNKVDKANAVIGADAQNRVYFFENEEDLKSFHPSAAGKQ
jgi:YHS domain-containing protein